MNTIHNHKNNKRNIIENNKQINPMKKSKKDDFLQNCEGGKMII